MVHGHDQQAARLGDRIDPTLQRRIEGLLTDFVDHEPTRSVALRTLRGPIIELSVNGELMMPAASLVKLPLAAAIFERAAAGEFALEDTVHTMDLGRTAYPSILQVFSVDHAFTLKELCGLMLATSDNPTSQYLLRLVGIDHVNDQAKRLGATNTEVRVGFLDELLGQEGRRNVTTANDALVLLRALASNPMYRPLMTALRNSLRNFRMPLRLPDTLPIAHKTGSLTGVAVDAGVVYGRSVDLAIAFLSDSQPDTAQTSISIGDCMGRIWETLGEDVDFDLG